jgi:hypothetical protein
MTPVAICRGLGEAKVKSIFLELTAEAMKKVMREGKLPTVRMASHTTTRKRNDDWANKVWRTITDKPEAAATPLAATLVFEWLSRARRPMLAEFLTGLGVQHDHGLTDADFMQSSAPELLVGTGKKLLEHHDRREVAAYLLFLDASNKSEVFAPLELEQLLAGPAAPSSETA